MGWSTSSGCPRGKRGRSQHTSNATTAITAAGNATEFTAATAKQTEDTLANPFTLHQLSHFDKKNMIAFVGESNMHAQPTWTTAKTAKMKYLFLLL